ncbi:hypothetical protein PRVXH_002339 [Proteinivorax hydrogeniformans]|uniref:N-acetyltransferase domain-containing protein n=1 Tax=Proteinivorax hydrogeniformans TaxID=1826727 RepID=A0AAU8HSG1_9FIRM
MMEKCIEEISDKILMEIKQINIVQAEKQHFAKMIEVANEQLGIDYVDKSTLENLAASPEKVANVAVDEKENVLGFSFGSLITAADLTKQLKIPREKVKLVAGTADKVGVFKTIAVKKECTKLGIGSRLAKDLITQMRDYAQVICSVAWKTPVGINIEKSYKKIN